MKSDYQWPIVAFDINDGYCLSASIRPFSVSFFTMTTITASDRFSVLPYLHRRMTSHGRRMGFNCKSRTAFASWKRNLITRLKEITGFNTMLKSSLQPRITETVTLKGYKRERIEIQVEPGIIMTLYALVPTSHSAGKGPYPVMLCPHGHASGGKYSPAGRSDIPQIRKQIKEYNYDYGVQFCKAGFIALCPDARGFGERVEPSVHRWLNKDLLTHSCLFINQMAYPLGQTVTGMWAWDLHRLIDYAETRPDCDTSRLGCAGLSGGGLQTLWATALDDRNRIKAAVVSGYFYGYRESLLDKHHHCSCNYVPHLYELADMGDLGALIAPRPLLIETGDADPLNGESGVSNVKSQVRITRSAYRLFRAEKQLIHDIFHGGHQWHGKIAVPWISEKLSATTPA